MQWAHPRASAAPVKSITGPKQRHQQMLSQMQLAHPGTSAVPLRNSNGLRRGHRQRLLQVQWAHPRASAASLRNINGPKGCHRLELLQIQWAHPRESVAPFKDTNGPKRGPHNFIIEKSWHLSTGLCVNMHSISSLAHMNICTCWPMLLFTIHTANMCMGSTSYYNNTCVMGSKPAPTPWGLRYKLLYYGFSSYACQTQ